MWIFCHEAYYTALVMIVHNQQLHALPLGLLGRVTTSKGPNTRTQLVSPGGLAPRVWTPTTPHTNCWPEAPLGGEGGLVGVGSGRGNGVGGGVHEGRLGEVQEG